MGQGVTLTAKPGRIACGKIRSARLDLGLGLPECSVQRARRV